MINKTIEKEMSTLVDTLNKYADAYYLRDESLISDKEYDALYDRLVVMERESGIILSDSPTQRPGGAVIDGLQKVFHSKPMLSAAKTKDISVLKDFIRAGEVPENPTPGKVIVSWKEDGLTIVLRYRKLPLRTSRNTLVSTARYSLTLVTWLPALRVFWTATRRQSAN